MTAPEREALVKRLRNLAERQGEDYIWRTAKAAADMIEALTRALSSIADMHCGDQPASSGHSEEIWLRLHIGKMRAAARAALKSTTPQTGGQE